MRKSWFLVYFVIPFLGMVFPGNPLYAHEPNVKVLVLIIASDQLPVYVELQKIWKSYMHLDPEHVEAYFIRGNPKLPTPYQIQGDVIWSKTDEGWIPQSAGIINKTVLSLEAMMPRLHEFDYVLRTNLSSFYVFPRLLQVLEKLPRKKCYFASQTGVDSGIGSGSGFILSPDLAEIIVKNKKVFLGHKKSPDDVMIGNFLKKQGYKLSPHRRIDFLTLDDWFNGRDSMPVDMFHFRVKTEDHLRLRDDIFIQSELLEIFYPEQIE
jgi:hypothetical protein